MVLGERVGGGASALALRVIPRCSSRPLMRRLSLILLLALSAPAAARAPAIVHVRLDTAAGPITLALDARHAPKTVANFMA